MDPEKQEKDTAINEAALSIRELAAEDRQGISMIRAFEKRGVPKINSLVEQGFFKDLDAALQSPRIQGAVAHLHAVAQEDVDSEISASRKKYVK